MSFSPDPTLLQQSIALLVGSQVPGADQAAVQRSLDEANKNPQFTVYLLYILVNGGAHSLPVELRQLAGLVGRGSIEHVYPTCGEAVQGLLKGLALQGLADSHPTIRSTTNNVVSTLARQPHALEVWPDLFRGLAALSQSPDAGVVETSLSTLANICEDVAHLLDSDSLGRPLNAMWPILMQFAANPNPVFTRLALKSMHHVTLAFQGDEGDELPFVVLSSISQYLELLSRLTQNPEPRVRELVCSSLVTLLDKASTHLKPFLPSLTDFFLNLCRSEVDEGVLLAGCEYWASLCEASVSEDKSTRALFLSKLGELVPLLIQRLRYSEEELADLPVKDVVDEGVPDAAEDVKPYLYRAKDEEDDPDTTAVEAWTVRRCCAVALDIIGNTIHDELLPPFLPALQTCFGSAGDSEGAWQARECGILALGSVSEGSGEYIAEHFGRIVPFLVAELKDTRPLIRSITAWTLGRYAAFIVADDDLCGQVLEGILGAMLDHTKKVQEAACASLGELIQHGGDVLLPYIVPIVSAISAAFGKYQAKNLLSLFDTVGMLAENLGTDLQSPEVTSVLLPPLIARWNSVGDADEMGLIPLLECMMFVSTALGPLFSPLAPEIYARCLRILEANLVLVVAAKEMRDEPPNKGFIVASVDMLDGLCGAIGASFEALMTADGGKLMPMVLYCMQDSSSDVQQSTFALLGDLVLYATNHVTPHLSTIVPLLVNGIKPERPKVTSNITWSLGELALKVGPAIGPAVETIVAKLGPTMNTADDGVTLRSLLVNMASCIGRLASQCPDIAAAAIPPYFFNWCRCIILIESQKEWVDSIMGAACILAAAPMLGIQHFTAVCYSFVSVTSKSVNAGVTPPPELIAKIRIALGAMKTVAGERWPTVLSGVDAEVLSFLEAAFGPVR